MSPPYDKELTKEQNQLLSEFSKAVAAEFRYRSGVRFATKSNKFRFTDRIFADNNSYPGLANVSNDERVQEIVADALINLKINNNKVEANGSMRLAYLSSIWSKSSNRYQRAISEVGASIDGNINFTDPEKSSLKLNADASFEKMTKEIFGKQGAETYRWISSRLKLNTDLTYDILENDLQIDSSAFVGLKSLIQNEQSDGLSSVTSLGTNLSTSLGSSNIVDGTEDQISKISSNIEFATNFKGNNFQEIDFNYGQAMSNTTVNPEFSSELDLELQSLISSNILSEQDAKDLKSELTADFTASLGANFVYICEDDD